MLYHGFTAATFSCCMFVGLCAFSFVFSNWKAFPCSAFVKLKLKVYTSDFFFSNPFFELIVSCYCAEDCVFMHLSLWCFSRYTTFLLASWFSYSMWDSFVHFKKYHFVTWVWFWFCLFSFILSLTRTNPVHPQALALTVNLVKVRDWAS